MAEKSTHNAQGARFTMAAALHHCGTLLSQCAMLSMIQGIASFEAHTISVPILRLPAQGHLIHTDSRAWVVEDFTMGIVLSQNAL